MDRYVLERMFRMLNIRGHIPGLEGHDVPRSGSSLTSSSSVLVRAVAAVVATAAFLVLILWTAVWLVLNLL